MNIQEIKALGEKTNRIIELESLLINIQKLAAHSLERERSHLNISIGHSCQGEKEDPLPEKLEEIFGKIFSHGRPDIKVIPLMLRSKRLYTEEISFSGRYQMILFDAITRALKEEQQDLQIAMKRQTGAL